MKYKLLVSDLDGAIAETGKPLEIETVKKLQSLEMRGLRIAFASGKSTLYLWGLARGMGIKNPLLVGENGCVVFEPANLKEIKIAERIPEISKIEIDLIKNYGNSIWIQTNQVALTVFPKKKEIQAELIPYLKRKISSFQGKLVVFEHEDAMDLMPASTDKGKALSVIKDLWNYRKDEIIAIGDWVNDVPMFKEAGLALIIGNKMEDLKIYKRFKDITAALTYLEEII